MSGANDFDQAARRAVRDAPDAHLRWLVPKLPRRIHVIRPLDSQSAPRPGEPDRRCDTVLEASYEGGLGVPWAVVVELFTAPDADALHRLLEYIGRFRREIRHGPHGQDRYRWAGVLLFLTDGPEVAEIEYQLGGCRLIWKPRLMRLGQEDALATLQAIQENRLQASILPWVPLMRGGQTADCASRWRDVCMSCEPAEMRRREQAGLASVFADLAECLSVWQPILEGFTVRESSVLRRERKETRT